MKKLIALSFCLMSLNVFAGETVKEAVSRVEAETNSTCMYKSTSSFSKCFGIPQTCFFTMKYSCANDNGAFQLKLKIREDHSGMTVYKTKIVEL